jgi:hypothetical protein
VTKVAELVADLGALQGRFVSVEYDTGRPEAGSQVVTGKLIVVTPLAIVVQQRHDTTMIQLGDLLEFSEVIKFTAKEALIIRELAGISKEGVRQHLLDRHGLVAEKVRSMTEEDALAYHDSIDHTRLGHVHGARERGRPGRKPRRAQETDAVRVQGQEEPDGGPTDVRDS